jgi:hypothetical protein
VIGFDGIVGLLLHDMARRRQQLIEYPWVGGRPISGHLGGAWAVLKSACEESASGRQIPILRDQNVDDLAILIDRPVQIAPAPGDFEVSSTNHRSPGACRQGRAASISSGVNRCTHR